MISISGMVLGLQTRQCASQAQDLETLDFEIINKKTRSAGWGVQLHQSVI